ncbi:MAG: DUF421 domain-containing protein [Bacteroides sp.]|nr:DUF421 domain-containing protein [Bacteroides sp.]
MFENIHLNTILSTTVIYLFIIIGIRWLGKEELGQLSVTDLIFVMLVSEAVGEAMIASNDSLWGGILAAGTLMVINKLFKIIVYKSKRLNEFMEGRPSIIIRNGHINKKEMRKNRITIEQLEQAGREHGIGDISTIALAILETDGKISILDNIKIKSSANIEK